MCSESAGKHWDGDECIADASRMLAFKAQAGEGSKHWLHAECYEPWSLCKFWTIQIPSDTLALMGDGLLWAPEKSMPSSPSAVAHPP